jgi:hypothetical protein
MCRKTPARVIYITNGGGSLIEIFSMTAGTEAAYRMFQHIVGNADKVKRRSGMAGFIGGE